MRRLMTGLIVFGAIGWLSAAVPAAAQDWPARAVRIIIPLGPGGGGDVFTRAVAEELQKSLGQPFIVENRPGGGLNIGTRACAEAAPDGYTLCVLSGEPVVYNQFTFKNLPFNPEMDLEPVANLFINANTLAANSSLGVKTIPELVALAKSKPGTLSYGTFSFMLVYFMDTLNKKNGIDIVRVPFRSGNEMVNAMVSGSTPIVFLGLSNMIGQIKAGQVVGIALNANTRSPLFPDIPTLKEATGEDYPPPWFGMFAPAGTPAPVRQGSRRNPAHHERTGVPRKVLHQSGGRSGGADARRVREVHRRQPRLRGARREGKQHPAAVRHLEIDAGAGRMFRIAIASLVAALAVAAPAAAQDYPARPVKLVFPLAAGGGGDVFSRALADELSKLWQQPVIVENRPGGGQNIGARACAEAVPDGYTICVMSSEPAVYNEFLYKSIPYNPEKDFTPIANLFFNTLSIVANSDLKVKSLPELIALAKTRQGLSYATFSFPLTVFMERLKKKENIDIVKVPYRGGGDVVDAVLGGSTPIALLALSNMVPQIQSPHHLARGDLENALAAVPGRADPEGGAGRGISRDLVRPVCAGGCAAADRREDRARRRPHHGRARVPQAHLYRPRR